MQQKFSPKFMFMSNGANSPAEFPEQGRREQHQRHLQLRRLVPGLDDAGNAQFITAYIAKYGGTADTIDNGSAEAYATGQVVEEVAKQTGKIDNATIIKTLHCGTWPTVGAT